MNLRKLNLTNIRAMVPLAPLILCLLVSMPLVYAYSTATHDIAILSVLPTKNVERQGYNATICVSLENRGNFPETFMVYTFCGCHQYITLPIAGSITINYTFKTATLPCGKCRPWAYVPPCFGDGDPANNIFIGEIFTVTFLTDITQDCKVNILDIARAARAFGSDPQNPRWDADCDIKADYRINILDIVAIALDFGKSI